MDIASVAGGRRHLTSQFLDGSAFTNQGAGSPFDLLLDLPTTASLSSSAVGSGDRVDGGQTSSKSDKADSLQDDPVSQASSADDDASREVNSDSSSGERDEQPEDQEESSSQAAELLAVMLSTNAPPAASEARQKDKDGDLLKGSTLAKDASLDKQSIATPINEVQAPELSAQPVEDSQATKLANDADAEVAKSKSEIVAESATTVTVQGPARSDGEQNQNTQDLEVAQQTEFEDSEIREPAVENQSGDGSEDIAEDSGLIASTDRSAQGSDGKRRDRGDRLRWFERQGTGQVGGITADRAAASENSRAVDAQQPLAGQAVTATEPTGAASEGTGASANLESKSIVASSESFSALTSDQTATGFGSVNQAVGSAGAASTATSTVSVDTNLSTGTISSSGAVVSEVNAPASSFDSTKVENQAQVGQTIGNAVSEGPVELTQAERVRLVQRIARSFSRTGPAGGEVNLRLHPPELGALAVQIRIEGRSMSAKMTAESQAAREVILESLPQLRTRLAEQGYDVLAFSVEVAADSASLNGSTTGNQDGLQQNMNGGQQSMYYSDSQRGRTSVESRRMHQLRQQTDAGIPLGQSGPTMFVGSRSIDIQA